MLSVLELVDSPRERYLKLKIASGRLSRYVRAITPRAVCLFGVENEVPCETALPFKDFSAMEKFVCSAVSLKRRSLRPRCWHRQTSIRIEPILAARFESSLTVLASRSSTEEPSCQLQYIIRGSAGLLLVVTPLNRNLLSSS